MSGSKDLIKGDERWIVEERKDGTNVGNWHWQELDCLPWAKQRLGELLAGREVLAGEGALWIKTTTVEAVTGECYVNRRKGKIIAGYELEVRIGWSGEARGEDGSKVYGSALGSFVIEYLGDENADEDAEVKVTVRGDGGGAGDRMRQALLKPGVKLIQEGIRTFVSELRKGGPAADGKKPLAAATSVSGDAKAALAAAPAEVAKKEKPKVKKEKGRTIKIEQSFYCRPMDIYECLMDERRMKAATYSDASISREEGGSFSIFSGNIVGYARDAHLHFVYHVIAVPECRATPGSCAFLSVCVRERQRQRQKKLHT